jgi:predicted nucleotidyltransferase
MNTQIDIPKLINQITPILREHSGLAAVYLLGSAITGKLRDDSDIDLALLPADDTMPTLQERLELAARLELALGRQVDLGVIHARNLVYAYEAILKGRRIITIDPDRADISETRFLGTYLQLRLDRHEVEEAYHAA